jgi:tRNA (cmo5U34)-methyltransferase
MSEFDIKAKTWDANPVNWERAEAIAFKIRQHIKVSEVLTALEFGAGTGILSFLLKDSLKEITLMDNSVEMVKVMEEKIVKQQVTHLKPLFFDLETNEFTSQTFDIILSQMVLHHVTDVKAMIAKFYRLLNAGGSIAIADLYSEDGSFHGSSFTGHLGFDMNNLSQMLLDSGFKNIVHEPCYVMEKETEAHGRMKFPLFILTATK